MGNINQANVNLIKETTNIDALNMELKNWDAEIGGVLYQVVRIKGHVHTVGGRYGACDLWAYPRAEKPTFKNLIQFNAYNPVAWGLTCKPKNYMCHENEARNSSIVTVTRNGMKFMTCAARGMNAGIDEARIAISKFTKHPLCLNSIDYDKNAVGRQIYYRGIPAIVTRFLKEQASVMIKADHEAVMKGDYPQATLPIYSYEVGITLNKDGELKVDILDPDVAWYRGEDEECPSIEAVFDGIEGDPMITEETAE